MTNESVYLGHQAGLIVRATTANRISSFSYIKSFLCDCNHISSGITLRKFSIITLSFSNFVCFLDFGRLQKELLHDEHGQSAARRPASGDQPVINNTGTSSQFNFDM